MQHVPGSGIISGEAQRHQHQLIWGAWIEAVALLWMIIEATISLTVGYRTHSVSLQGFGLDSIIELISGGVLLWRLLVERRKHDAEVVERAEHIAAWIAALGLFALALYIIAESTWTFWMRSYPLTSWWGIGLALAAAVIMPVLWQGKLRVAEHIGSAALKADAMCSATCAYMSLTLLVGLGLNALFGWWWADPLAALALVYFIVREGQEALHEAHTGEACGCECQE